MTATATELRPLEVIETGDRMVFWVRSETKPLKVYVVDALAHQGRMECSCANWRIVRWALIKLGRPITDKKTRCKHGVAVREHILNTTLPRMAQKENEPSCPA